MTITNAFPTELNKQEMAAVLGISAKQFGRYVEEAKMPYTGEKRGAKYIVADCVQAYSRIQTDIAIRANRGPESVTEEDAKVRKLVAEARIAEYKAEQVSGNMVTVDESDAVIEKIVTTLRYQLLGIPGAWTPQLLGKTDELEMALTLRRLTDNLMTAGFEKVIQDVQTFGVVVDPDSDSAE